MSDTPSMLLVGVGTAGCAIARGVNRAFGEGLRYLLVDTDAATSGPDEPFLLLGGNRLSGRGAGGDTVAASTAAEESISTVDEHLEGVRIAVIVTALGGGTGCGATHELLKHLAARGMPSVVFATTPFAFESSERRHQAETIVPMIEDVANATFVLPLDKLVSGEDNMNEAMRRAVDTVATGVTLFWRLVSKPGYIRLDTERLRHLVVRAGRGRFAAVTAQGPDRASEAINQLIRSEMLAGSTAPVQAILCGVLAGDDLRLAEVGQISDGLRYAFGDRLGFDLGTVNDEATFSGRLSVVVMLFEAGGKDAADAPVDETATTSGRKSGHRAKGPLGVGPTGRGRFNNAESTIWHGEDLDIPTFKRRGINLDF